MNPSPAPHPSFVLHGISAAPGVAIARAQLVSHATLEVAHYNIGSDQIETEQARFDRAVQTVHEEIARLREQVRANPLQKAPSLSEGKSPGGELGAFLDVHEMLLADESLSLVPRQFIAQQSCNAEWAITQQMNVLVEQFEQFEDEYLRERKADVVHVVERVLKALMGKHALAPLPRDQYTVLVAHDLSPADVIQYKDQAFAAFITDLGGVTSHTAIVARSLDIPSVVALHNARSLIRDREQIIVDGDAGLVIVNPDEAVLAEYRLKQDALKLAKQKLRLLVAKPAESLDGTRIALNANIELPEDLPDVLENGADGVGLFRSEFLFLNRQDLPSEDEQFEAYRAVALGMQGKPVTIRSFDLGADKRMPGVGDRVSVNPAMGLRAIRLCLAEPALFLTQLRAILRASAFGKVKLLIPMLANTQEMTQTLRWIDRAKSALDREGISYDPALQVGAMVEVPASVLALPMFASRLDFMSIGTNDLIQYTLAIDRGDDAVAHLYDPLHPAVLRLLFLAINAANKANCPIAMCGEMAGDVRYTRLLLGLGLREFSMHPSMILSVKQRVLHSDIKDTRDAVARILKSFDESKIEALVEKLNLGTP